MPPQVLSLCSSSQMVGIGTSDVNLDKYRHTFCSLLGKDEDSWGLSYTGDMGRAAGKPATGSGIQWPEWDYGQKGHLACESRS